MRAVPAAGLGRRDISTGKKIQQLGIGIGRRTHGLVGKDELAELGVELRAFAHRALAETARLRVCVRVERRSRVNLAAGPEARAADLMRIRLARNTVGQPRRAAGVARRLPTRKTRNREIEAAPEEVHRARLTEEAGSELLEDAID